VVQQALVHVADLLDIQGTEGEAPRLGWQHLAEQTQGMIALQEVDGCDQARRVRPGVDVDAPGAAQLFHQIAIHDAEL